MRVGLCDQTQMYSFISCREANHVEISKLTQDKKRYSTDLVITFLMELGAASCGLM